MRTVARLLVLLTSGALPAIGAEPAGAAPPGAATLVAPAGLVPGGTLTFTWQAAGGATFYYLHVNDTTASPKLTLWYPAGQACPADSATCSVTLTTGWGAGAATWWIQTWNADGLGPWSAGMQFRVQFVPGAWSDDMPAAERFQLVLGGQAVLDRETGLVWQRTPPPASSALSWGQAFNTCKNEGVAGRFGFRLPTYEELKSLITIGGLPQGHPFAVEPSYRWTATTNPENTAYAYVISLTFGSGTSTLKTDQRPRWCVRGGVTPQGPQ
jgi:hypothetical protein